METLTPSNAQRVLKKYGGIEAKPVGPLDKGMVVGIVAPGGTGKTTVASTITDSPLGSPALYFDLRGNPFVISSYSDRIDVIQPPTFVALQKAIDEFENDKDSYHKSIIVDTVTEAHAIDLRDRYGPMAIVDWQKHSASTAAVLQLVRRLVALAEGPKKINVVLTFHEVTEVRTIRGQKDVARAELAANKALQAQLPGIINLLGFLHIDSDTAPYTRLLDFTPAEKVHQAKFQIDPNHEILKTIPMQQWKPNLADMLETLRGEKPFPIEKHKKV